MDDIIHRLHELIGNYRCQHPEFAPPRCVLLGRKEAAEFDTVTRSLLTVVVEGEQQRRTFEDVEVVFTKSESQFSVAKRLPDAAEIDFQAGQRRKNEADRRREKWFEEARKFWLSEYEAEGDGFPAQMLPALNAAHTAHVRSNA